MAKMTGIRKHRGGWEVRWTGNDGRPRTKRFAIETAEQALRDYRDREIAKVTLSGPVVIRGTFEDERDRFLKGMKEGSRRYKDFDYQLRAWLPHFKGMRLNAIEDAHINAALGDWQQDGAANATLMRLRSALMSLLKFRAPDRYKAIDWKRGVLSYKIPKPRPRACDLGLLAAIFAKAPRCKTKARQMMIFYFGARPSEIMRLRQTDIALDETDPHVFFRSADENPDDSEGKGTNDRIIPIVDGPQRQAVTMFVETEAWGKYSTAAARTSFLRWARNAGLTEDQLIEGETRRGTKRYRIRPYDLRHTFATELRKVPGVDLKDVGDALGHRNLKTTERYAPKQDAKVADGLRQSAIHTVPVNLMAQVAALSAEARAKLLETLQSV